MTFAGRIAIAAALAVAAAAGTARAEEIPPAAAAAPAPVTPLLADADKAASEADKLAEQFVQDSDAVAAESSLKFYGFADFNAIRWFSLSDQWKNQFPEKLSFYIGKLNLYMEGNIAPDWKSLFEVRYMFIPNGSSPQQGVVSNGYLDPITNSGRLNGVTGDYTEIGRPVDWNGINIQRAYL